MDIVDNMLKFFENGSREELLENTNCISTQDLRIVVINILSWLRLEHKRSIWMKQGRITQNKPLILSTNAKWCNNIYALVNNEERFKKYFTIKDGKFMFADPISEEERERIREKVYKDYELEWRK